MRAALIPMVRRFTVAHTALAVLFACQVVSACVLGDRETTVEPSSGDAASSSDAATMKPFAVEAADGHPTLGAEDGGEPTCPANPDALGPADGCAVIPLIGPCVVETVVPEFPPNPAGGAPVDGSYDLVAYTTYTNPGGFSGPSGSAERQSLLLSNGSLIQAVQTSLGLSYQTYVATFSGTQATLASSCGASLSDYVWGYTATSSALQLFLSTSETPTDVLTFLRR
jgi:hypothetical protein